MPPLSFKLSVNRCPHHPSFWSVCLDAYHEGALESGTRLTNSKCCGSWKLQRSFPMRLADLESMRDEIEHAIGLLREQENAA